MVGGQLQQRRRSGQRALPVPSPAAAVSSPLEPLRAATPHSPRTGSRKGGSGSGPHRPMYAAYSALQLPTNTPIDQPSEMMWCIVTSSTWSSSASRIKRPRINGPVSSSNSAARLFCEQRLQRPGRRPRPSRSCSSSASPTSAGAISCTASISTITKRVRKLS